MTFQTKQTFVIDASNALDNTTSLKIEDVTDLTVPGFLPEQLDSILKITDPSGEIIHENVDFDNPDIDYDVDRVFELGVLNEDVSTDLPIEGTYYYEMLTRIKSSISFPSIFSNVITAPTSIKILQALTIDETVDVEITTGAPNPSTNAGTYTIISVTYDEDGFPTINIDGSIDDDPILTDVITFGILEYETTNKSFEYKFAYPELKLEVVSDCDYGTIEFIDNTLFSYPITIDNRVGTIKYPENGVNPPANVVFSTQSKKLVELYTGTYNFVVEREVAFTIQSVEQTFVESTLIASKTHTVDCSNSLCCISDCLSNLIKRYEAALCTNYTKAKELQDQLLLITGKIQLARIIRYCGKPGYSALLSEIKELFGETGCACGCDEETDGLSRKVTPVTAVLGGGGIDVNVTSQDGSVLITSSLVGTTTTFDLSIPEAIIKELQGEDGATILTGEDVPTLSLGNVGDIYVRTTTGDLYVKIQSAGFPFITGWVLQTNLQGPQGLPGADGLDGAQVIFRSTPPVSPGDDSLGTEGSIMIVTKDARRSVYQKSPTVWVKVDEIYAFEKTIQDNTEQAPLQPNIPGPLVYIDGQDVFLRTTFGNVYTAQYLKKVDEALSPIDIRDGETVSFFNVGQANVTFEGSGQFLDPVTNSEKNFQYILLEDLVIPPGGAVKFRYSPDNGGSNADFEGKFVLASKNF